MSVYMIVIAIAVVVLALVVGGCLGAIAHEAANHSAMANAYRAVHVAEGERAAAIERAKQWRKYAQCGGLQPSDGEQ